jgi:hypothetical protein
MSLSAINFLPDSKLIRIEPGDVLSGAWLWSDPESNGARFCREWRGLHLGFGDRGHRNGQFAPV